MPFPQRHHTPLPLIDGLALAHESLRVEGEGVGEELPEERRVDGGAGLDEAAARLLDALNQVGRQQRRGEGQQVEGDEEELVEGAKDEQDVLQPRARLVSLSLGQRSTGLKRAAVDDGDDDEVVVVAAAETVAAAW